MIDANDLRETAHREIFRRCKRVRIRIDRAIETPLGRPVACLLNIKSCFSAPIVGIAVSRQETSPENKSKRKDVAVW